MQRTTGTHVDASLTGIRYRAFVPAPLPPDPPIAWTSRLETLRDSANRALGRLDGITGILPDAALFLYQYVRKEAVLSSQIEGTRSSLSDLLLYEMEAAPGVPMDDAGEVSNYMAAMTHGLQRIRDGFPLSLRLLREIHAILLRGGRGAEKEPGTIRRSQVWIGGPTPALAEFVPPPPERIVACLAPFERFLHGDTPVLMRAGLAHVQFETIHPFKDGNGRLGRLLIALLLCAEGALSEPMLYLSLYFKRNRREYYDRLQAVRAAGDWEGWLLFFFAGVEEVARSAVEGARSLLTLFEQDRQRLQQLGRGAGSAIRLQQYLQEHPIIRAPSAASALKMSVAAVNNTLKRLQGVGLLREVTGKKRDRLFAYDAYLRLLSEGTEPLPMDRRD